METLPWTSSHACPQKVVRSQSPPPTTFKMEVVGALRHMGLGLGPRDVQYYNTLLDSRTICLSKRLQQLNAAGSEHIHRKN